MSEDRREQQESFLARWSRRKTLSRQGEVLPEPAADADELPPAAADHTGDASPAPEAGTATRADEAGDIPVEADTELPSLESLDENSDYSAFLGDNVPTDMRQKALRKLFHSPKFNVRDGLDDYDLDFTKREPLGDIITAEMRYRMKRELERLAGLDDEENPDDSPATAAAETGEPGDAQDPVDPEADDERPEPS